MSTSTSTIRKTGYWLSAAALLAAPLTAAFTPAAASAKTVPRPVVASTIIKMRPDHGGAGNTWAYDNMTRQLTISYLGKSTDPAHAAAPYMFAARTDDLNGTFVNLPGQLAPNQGGRYAGVVMRPHQVGGPFTGYGQYGLFYASAKPSKGLVPRALKGITLNTNPAYASSTWPELAFPAGTTFAGLSESVYGYDYTANWTTYRFVVKTDPKTHKKVTVTVTVNHRQEWKDTWDNGDGQLPRDGQILGH